MYQHAMAAKVPFQYYHHWIKQTIKKGGTLLFSLFSIRVRALQSTV